jgi:hypothetical protein
VHVELLLMLSHFLLIHRVLMNCVQTIDNDVAMLDRSFGFETSVEAAQHAIRAAVTEASCNLPNGIGIVKVCMTNIILCCIIIVHMYCSERRCYMSHIYVALCSSYC